MIHATIETNAKDRAGVDACPGVVTFPEGLVGLPLARRFTFETSDEIAPFLRMRCQDHPDLSFLVVDPALVVPHDRTAWNEDVRGALGLEAAAAPLVLVIATIALPAEESTANLLAPLVIDPEGLSGRQVVLDVAAYSARHPLVGTLR